MRVPPKLPRHTKTFTFGTSEVKVFGSRSLKGWRILQATQPAAEPKQIDTRPTKEEAVQFAVDGAKETPGSYYHVRPIL